MAGASFDTATCEQNTELPSGIHLIEDLDGLPLFFEEGLV